MIGEAKMSQADIELYRHMKEKVQQKIEFEDMHNIRSEGQMNEQTRNLDDQRVVNEKDQTQEQDIRRLGNELSEQVNVTAARNEKIDGKILMETGQEKRGN